MKNAMLHIGARSMPRNSIANVFSLLKFLLFILVFIFYAVYLFFAIRQPFGPIDYETFMSIGRRFLAGTPVYVVNSYYPLPMVVVFAGLSMLPRWLSMLIWSGWPIVFALLLSPSLLLFAPIFTLFSGGNASMFAALGLWGYYFQKNWMGGVLLALAMLKPHVGLLIVVWAVVDWVKQYSVSRQVPSQFIGFAVASGLIWLPCFIFYPTWFLDWLQNARPIMTRGLVSLPWRAIFEAPQGTWSVALVALVTTVIVVLIYFDGPLDLKRTLLLAFCLIPLFNDYDLVLLIPFFVEDKRLRAIAILTSIPAWIVLSMFYRVDTAWAWVGIIPPVLLWFTREHR